MLPEEPVEAWREVASKCERNCHRGFGDSRVVEVVHVSSSSVFPNVVLDFIDPFEIAVREGQPLIGKAPRLRERLTGLVALAF